MDLSISKDNYSLTKKPGKGKYIDSAIEAIKFDFQPVKLTSPDLNLIAAESVLAPGKTVVKISDVYTPYDVMLVGMLVV